MGFQEDLNEIKRVLANSKLRSELPPGTPENGDLVGFFNSVLNREERIEWSQFVGLAASAGITFEPNGDFYDVKVNNSTVFQVSKAGQTGQYADILNAPDLTQYQLKNEKGIAFGYTPTDVNNKVPVVHIPDLPYVPTGGYSGTGQDLQDQIDGLDQAIILQNTPFDASTGVFPGGGTAQAGYKYLVSVGGTVDGKTFANGDSITAIIDNASTTTYAGNWQKINNAESVQNFQQVTDQGATTTNEVESTSSFKAPQFKISNAGFEAILSALLTVSRNISFQDKDGTVALLSDVTAAAILTKLITVDGSGSGLDADLLDGLQSSQFLRSDQEDTANENIEFLKQIFVNGSFINKSVGAIQIFGDGPDQGLTIWNESGAVTKRIWSDAATNSLYITAGSNPTSGCRLESGGNFVFSQYIKTIQPSGYTTALTLSSLADNDWITKKQFNDNKGVNYTSYVALVSQSGTSAPTLIVLENTTGLTITPSYTSVGEYTFTYSSAQDADKIYASITQNQTEPATQIRRSIYTAIGTAFKIYTVISSSTMQNGLLNDTPIEIRIYP